MGKIKKNDNLIIKDLMSSYKSRDLFLYQVLRKWCESIKIFLLGTVDN